VSLCVSLCNLNNVTTQYDVMNCIQLCFVYGIVIMHVTYFSIYVPKLFVAICYGPLTIHSFSHIVILISFLINNLYS